jgi:hypothetical protein
MQRSRSAAYAVRAKSLATRHEVNYRRWKTVIERSASRKLPGASGDAAHIFAQSPILRQDRLRHHGCPTDRARYVVLNRDYCIRCNIAIQLAHPLMAVLFQYKNRL